jgi:hypothetical protein
LGLPQIKSNQIIIITVVNNQNIPGNTTHTEYICCSIGNRLVICVVAWQVKATEDANNYIPFASPTVDFIKEPSIVFAPLIPDTNLPSQLSSSPFSL